MKLVNLGCDNRYHKDWVNLDFKSNSEYIQQFNLQKKLLNKVGFKDIQKKNADESKISKFNSYLLDIETDGSIRKPDSLFMEGCK